MLKRIVKKRVKLKLKPIQLMMKKNKKSIKKQPKLLKRIQKKSKKKLKARVPQLMNKTTIVPKIQIMMAGS